MKHVNDRSKHVTDRLQALVSGELSSADAQVVNEHLARCPSCAQEAVQVRSLWDELEPVDQITPTRPSVWPAIRSRTVACQPGLEVPGTSRWSQAGFVALTLAAGLALAVLMPDQADKASMLAQESETATGGSFWLDEQSDTTLNELWLASVDEGEGS